MRAFRGVAVVVAAALAVGVLTATAGAQSPSDKPTATDVGITASQIHVAVVADVDNPLAPNLFQGAVDGVQGWARYVNSKAGGGGLAGRKVVVDFYDSHLNPTQTRNAEIQACQNDVAMVGTAAAFLSSVDDMRGCKDSSGAVTGIPDIPFYAGAIVQQCSDQSFPIAPPQVVCSTKDENPQTYQADVARGYYYQDKYGKNLHGVYVFSNDSKASRDAAFVSLGALRQIGITSDADYDRSSRATQSEYTEIVQTMKNKQSNYAQCTGPYACTVALRKEAALQGVTGIKVWDCGVQCYDKQFLQAAGADAENQYADTGFLPFYNKADIKANPMLANLVKYTGADKVVGYSMYSFAAGLAFSQAVTAQVKAGGVNSVTRKTIFEQLNKIHQFNASGIIAPIDLAGRQVSGCSVVNQVQHGTLVRVAPSKPGTFDCPKNGRITYKYDLTGS